MKFRVAAVVVIACLHGMSVPSSGQVPGGEFSSFDEFVADTRLIDVRAIYDPETGEVWVSVNSGPGNRVLILGLEGTEFLLDNLNTDTLLGDFEQADASGIGQLSFSGLPSGLFNFGPILPSSPDIRTAMQLATTYPRLRVRSGGAAIPESSRRLDVLVIPEPTSPLIYLGIGLMVCIGRRRSVG
jgi:hypothetical protein